MLKNPLQFSLATLLFVTFLVAIGMTVGPVTWFLIGVIECCVFYLLLRCFHAQMPSAIKAQMKRNRFRADGSVSSHRKKIEKAELSRFLHNVAILLLLFLVATNVGLLAIKVEQVFEAELYVVDSAEIEERPGRTITEAQYANELGAEMLATFEPVSETSSSGSTRQVVLIVTGVIWFVTALLIPVGYLGMLKVLAAGAVERGEYYSTLDYHRESDSSLT